MIGIQVVCFKYGLCTSQIFWMGTFSYLGIVAFTFGLLRMVQSEVVIEEELLPAAFGDAVWTFSDSHHAAHRPIIGPRFNSLIIAGLP